MLRLLRGACDNARTCPNINLTDRGTYVVQGYPAPASGGQSAVEIPAYLLPELADAPDWNHVGVQRLDAETLLISGVRVTDPALLAELALPVGEDAVEIQADALPPLREVFVRVR